MSKSGEYVIYKKKRLHRYVMNAGEYDGENLIDHKSNTKWNNCRRELRDADP